MATPTLPAPESDPLRAGLLAEQRHQFLDPAEPPLACDGPALPKTGDARVNPRDKYIAGLRAFANWLEASPEMQEPINQQLLVPLMTNAATESFAKTHGLDVAYDAEGNASCSLKFGPITYHAYGYVDFAEHVERANERDARRWADRKGLVIQPADDAGTVTS